MASGAVLGEGVEAGSGGDGTASAGSALEAASTLRTRRASGSNVRVDTRGTGSSYWPYEMVTDAGSQGKLVNERSRPGSARSAFQAAQAASTTAS